MSVWEFILSPTNFPSSIITSALIHLAKFIHAEVSLVFYIIFTHAAVIYICYGCNCLLYMHAHQFMFGLVPSASVHKRKIVHCYRATLLHGVDLYFPTWKIDRSRKYNNGSYIMQAFFIFFPLKESMFVTIKGSIVG